MMYLDQLCLQMTLYYVDRHDRVIGDLEECIRGQRDEDQKIKTQFMDFTF